MSVSLYAYKAYLTIRGGIGKSLYYASSLDHVTAGQKSLITHGRLSLENSHKIAVYTAYQDFHNDIGERNLLDSIKLSGFQLLTIANVEKHRKEIISKFDFIRENKGYDIAACRDVLRKLNSVPVELLLINSSTAWDLNAALLIKKAQALSLNDQCDIVYATQSFQTKEHGQSFFIYARGDGVRILMEVLESAKNWKTRRATVYFGEILLLEKLRKQKAKVGFLFKYSELVHNYYLDPIYDSKTHKKLQMKLPVNPTHDFWKILIKLNSQFVKRNLFSVEKKKSVFLPNSIEEVFTVKKVVE
jgi:hypothetical protein